MTYWNTVSYFSQNTILLYIHTYMSEILSIASIYIIHLKFYQHELMKILTVNKFTDINSLRFVSWRSGVLRFSQFLTFEHRDVEGRRRVAQVTQGKRHTNRPCDVGYPEATSQYVGEERWTFGNKMTVSGCLWSMWKITAWGALNGSHCA